MKGNLDKFTSRFHTWTFAFQYIHQWLIFILEIDVSNYSDDTGLHICNKDLPNLLNSVEHDTHIAIEWVERNYMKLDKVKCNFFISGHKNIYGSMLAVPTYGRVTL